MAQPVDFVGLNTFLYEPCGWNIDEQKAVITVQNENFVRGNVFDIDPEFFEQFPVDFNFRTDKLTIALQEKELVSRPIIFPCRLTYDHSSIGNSRTNDYIGTCI